MENGNSDTPMFLKQPPRLMGLNNYFVQPSSDNNGNTISDTSITPILKEVYNLKTQTQTVLTNFQSDIDDNITDIKKELILLRKSFVSLHDLTKQTAKKQLELQEKEAKRQALSDRYKQQLEKRSSYESTKSSGRSGIQGRDVLSGRMGGTIVEGLLDTLFPGLGRAGLTRGLTKLVGKSLGIIGVLFGKTTQTLLSKNFYKSIGKIFTTSFTKLFRGLKVGSKGLFTFLAGKTADATLGLRKIGSSLVSGFKKLGATLWKPSKTTKADVLDAEGNVIGQTTATEKGGLTKTGMIATGIGGAALLGGTAFAIWKSIQKNSNEQLDILEGSKDIQQEQLDGFKDGSWFSDLGKHFKGLMSFGKDAQGNEIDPTELTALERKKAWDKAHPVLSTIGRLNPLGAVVNGVTDTMSIMDTVGAMKDAKEAKEAGYPTLDVPNIGKNLVRMQDIISPVSKVDPARYNKATGKWEGNTAPYTLAQNAKYVKQLDDFFTTRGYRPVYTSNMGGHTSGGHVKGNKVDVQLFDKVGRAVKLSQAELAELRKSGYWGGSTGALGWEAVSGQVGGGHYDLFVGLSGATGALSKFSGAVNNATDALKTGFLDFIEQNVGNLQDYLAKLQIKDASSDYDARTAGYNQMASGISTYETQMERQAREKAEFESDSKNIGKKYIPQPGELETQVIPVMNYGTTPTTFNADTSVTARGIDMTLLEFTQLMFQS